DLPALDLGAEVGSHFRSGDEEHTTASLDEDLTHQRQQLDLNTRNGAVHMANAGAARERSMRALRDGDLAGFQQNQALLDRMHAEGEHLVRDREHIVAAPHEPVSHEPVSHEPVSHEDSVPTP